MAPVNNGALLTAARYVAERLSLSTRDTTRDFLETLAVTNWCKFSIRSPKNADYIGDGDKLAASLPYVLTELETLQPSVVIIPKGVWKRPHLSAAMRRAIPNARILPVYQFNATVVNCHLFKYDKSARELQQRMSGKPLAEWMRNLVGFNKDNAWRYLAFISSILPEQANAFEKDRT